MTGTATSNITGRYAGVEQVVIGEHNVSQRLDNFLITRLKGVPKSRIYRLIRKGEVRINGKRTEVARKLELGDTVRIPPVRVAEKVNDSMPGARISQLLESSVIFEDESLLVVNKPSGLAVHGGSGIRIGVIESFRKLRPDVRFMELVHRIDRDTSGCLLIAKKPALLRHLHEEIRGGRMFKAYKVLVSGKWPTRKHVVNARLKKNVLQSGERIVRVSHDEGKPSRTRFEVIGYYQDFTLLKAVLDTGRTHQIRVHALSTGHPVAGDKKYGDKEGCQSTQRSFTRLMLHAWKLGFKLPDGREVDFEAPLPGEFENILNGLRVSSE